ncbi:MAG: hypothetical protein AAF915_07015 [Cyanobacteria bacterium P01_D01_bin.50]
MKIFGFKLKVTEQQLCCIEEIMRTSQFVRNKCLRNWMHGRKVNKYDHYKYMAVPTAKYPFANKPNSIARQSVAGTACSAISLLYVKSAEQNPLLGRLSIASPQERLCDNSEKIYSFEPDFQGLRSNFALLSIKQFVRSFLLCSKSLSISDGKSIRNLKLKGTYELCYYSLYRIEHFCLVRFTDRYYA